MAVTKITDRQAVQSIDLTTEVTGILPAASGGTGAATLTGILKGNGTSAVTAVTAPSGAIVGTTDAQTLTNKTADSASNTITNVTGVLQPVRCLMEGSAVHTISAGNVTQIAGTTVDGITVAIGDRIVVVGAPASTGAGLGSSTQPGNGIYVVTGNTTNLTLSRAADFSGTVMPWGLSVPIREGSVWGVGYEISWVGSGAFTWGTTALVGYSGYIRNKGISVNAIVDKDFAQTLTNKRITKRIGGTTSSTTPTANADTQDQYNLTAQTTGMTFGAPTGTPTDGQQLMYRIKTASAQTIAFNAIFRAMGVTAPTTTAAGKTTYIGTIYNAADTKWDILAVGQET